MAASPEWRFQEKIGNCPDNEPAISTHDECSPNVWGLKIHDDDP